MAEYYTVLKKAVGKLGANTADARRTVYGEVRKALIEELKAAAPPLSKAEIAGQRLELEEAIRKVEREAVANSQRPSAPARPEAPLTPNSGRVVRLPLPASAPAEEDSHSPQEVFRRAMHHAERRGSPAGVAGAIERAAVSKGAELNQYSRATAELRSSGEPVIERAPPADPGHREREEPRPNGGGPDAPVLDGREAPDPAPAAEGPLSRGGLIRPSRLSAKARPSRPFSFLLTVLIIAIVLGAGALAWSKRVMIGQIITALDGRRAVVGAVNPPVDDAASPAAPIAPGVAAIPAPPADAGAKPAPTHAATDEASPASPPVASESDNADVSGGLVAQKATLHEESVNFTGVTSINAAVTWRYLDDGANGPAIEANLQVPERRMKIKLTIHKNTDNSLAASHLIEIKIDAPSDLPGKSVQKLTRIVMKPTEEARGQPLSGAEAKITDGFFWIALSGADLDLPRNLALLRDGEWIDLPFTYETGQRAILTFEKGSQGDQVFEKAMAAWTAG